MANLSDEEETLVTIGTPLEVPDEDELLKRPIKIQDIQAKDDKGRTRFHGAFTGGFSAGYFNSVGSKEGWTPSNFISSRNERFKDKQAQKPEDFMDEEDMGEYGIAPRKFVTGSKFSSEERKKRQLDEAQMGTADSVLPGASVLLEIIVPDRLTIGVKLLRKMGWKEGQGIGPRLSKKQKTKSLRKMYGCLPTPDLDDKLGFDDIFSDVTFAPTDSANILMSVKDNTKGLGYQGLDPKKALPSTHIHLFEAPRVTKGGSRRGIRGQAFGVGALEEDDDDIYSTDTMSNYDMTMDSEHDDKYGWTGPSGKGASEAPVGYVGSMLDGFILSSKKLVQKKDFPPVKLPRDFRPVHSFRTAEISSNVNSLQGNDSRQLLDYSDKNIAARSSVVESGKNSVYTDASSRSLALEEKPFVGSVFDLISEESKRKLSDIKQGTSKTTDSPYPAKPNHTLSEEKTKCAAGTSSENVPLFQGSHGFKPFQRDPQKQERYERYIDLVNSGNKDPFSSIVTSYQTEWEKEKEKEEFTRAAKLYRPLSGMMAVRFTSAGQEDGENKPMSRLEEKMDVNDEMKAAEMKMYGKLTRQVLEWHPDNVICKRFNVPNPYPGSTLTGSAAVKRDKYSVFNFLNFSDPTRSDSDHMTESGYVKPLNQSDITKTVNAVPSKSLSSESDKSESTADGVLNTGKSVKSIFSHLVDTDSGNTKQISFSLKSSSKPMKFTSIFSHLKQSDEPVKIPEEEFDKAGTDVAALKSGVSKKTEDSGMDLFRAIFRNSDSEDSSSCTEETGKDDYLQADNCTNIGGNQTQNRTSPVNIEPSDRRSESVNVPGECRLPGNDKQIESITSRLSPTVESDESYGPALPPALSTVNASASTSIQPSQHFIDLTQKSSFKHKEKHKSKKDKKDKHKKSKHKKKSKSKKKKTRCSKPGTDSDTTDKDTDDDVDLEILSRLKSIKSSQRKKMMDIS